MNKKYKSKNIHIKNSLNKEKSKFSSTKYFNINKNKSVFSPINNSNKKYNFNKIIINNIKKYNFNKEKFNISIIDAIITHRCSNYASLLNDKIIINNNIEYLKRYYIYKDIAKKFHKFYLYYKNYFKFFLKPTLNDFSLCDMLRKQSGKQANIFYDKFKNKIKNNEINNKYSFKSIFSKKQKKELNYSKSDSKIDIKNKKFIEKEKNNLSTIIFSYESLNNSKEIDKMEEISLSILSFENLKNQFKNKKIKNKENKENKGKNYINNKANFFLNLDNDNKNKNINNKKAKKFNVFMKSKGYANDKNSRNKNNDRNYFNLYTKNERQTEILKNNTKKNIIVRNNSNKHKINFKNLFYTKEQNNGEINCINSSRNRAPSYPLKIDYCQTTEIINNNKKLKNNNNLFNIKKPFPISKSINQYFIANNLNYKQPTIFTDYSKSSTQITKIKNKTLFSRNLNNYLTQSQKNFDKIKYHRKGEHSQSSAVNIMNKKKKLFNNNYLYFSSKNNVNQFDMEEKNFKNINNYMNSENKIYIKNIHKKKSYSSTIEDKENRLNRLINELISIRYNHSKKEFQILEYSKKGIKKS